MLEPFGRTPRPRHARTPSMPMPGPWTASASLAAAGDPEGSRTCLDVPHVDGARAEPDHRDAGVAGLLRTLTAGWRGGLASAAPPTALG